MFTVQCKATDVSFASMGDALFSAVHAAICNNTTVNIYGDQHRGAIITVEPRDVGGMGRPTAHVEVHDWAALGLRPPENWGS